LKAISSKVKRKLDPQNAIDISNYLLWHYRKWGKYRLAEKYGLHSLDLAKRNFEPGHPTIARSQSNLALVLQDLGELKDARDLLRHALAADQNNFEPGHPTIAIRQSNLAMVLKDLGELKEARKLAKKACDTFLATFGPQHLGYIAKQIRL
jgi:tetratricopeptide (TPR) repeat protein